MVATNRIRAHGQDDDRAGFMVVEWATSVVDDIQL
jgi:hypothetical protein